jgi:hypothetical protein
MANSCPIALTSGKKFAGIRLAHPNGPLPVVNFNRNIVLSFIGRENFKSLFGRYFSRTTPHKSPIVASAQIKAPDAHPGLHSNFR